MAKTLKEAAITTANARARLPPGLHWRSIDPEIHLGYRKGARGGIWLVRWRNGIGYQQKPIGTADDIIKIGTLDYNDAIKSAREKVTASRLEAKASADGLILTVGLAAASYIAARDARHSKRLGRPVRSDTAARLGRYVLGLPGRGKRKAIPAAPLADVPLHLLKESDLLIWRSSLPESLKETAKHRLTTDLKAALNRAFANNRERLNPSMATVIKYGLKAAPIDDDETIPVARESQILSDLQIGHLLQAAKKIDDLDNWEGDLFRLIVALAASGARFSQIIRMRVADVQSEVSRLIVPASRKGVGKSGSVSIPVGKDTIDVLLPPVISRSRDELLFTRWRHKQAPGSIQWQRESRGPWKTASELAQPWAYIRDAIQMPQLVPYALRHSSIVRCIRKGLPIRLVAAIHDTSVQMIEKHYSRWITDGLEELVARAVVPLIMQDEIDS